MQIEDLYLVSYPSALCTKWMLKKFIFTPFSTFEIVIDFYFEIMNIIFSVYKRNGVIVSRSCTKRKLQSTYICSVFFIIYIRLFCRVLADSFLAPLQDAVDDWKKTSSILEKDHAKGISHHCSSLFSFEKTLEKGAYLYCFCINVTPLSECGRAKYLKCIQSFFNCSIIHHSSSSLNLFHKTTSV